MANMESELQEFINQVTKIKKENYQEFIRIKYIVDGVLLAKNTSLEDYSQKVACEG